MKRSRLIDIDIAKGFAIFLVVLGHIVATDIPLGNEWFLDLKIAIYRFHMPFFMFLSGLIMAYTYKGVSSYQEYFSYVWKRFKRLAPAFILFGMIIYFGKVLISQYMHVDGLTTDLYSELINLLVNPTKSAAGSLWFVYVLMEMYIIFPLLILATNRFPPALLLLGLILYFVPMTEYFLLHRFADYMLFFALGVVVVRYYEFYLRTIDQYWLYFMFLFLFSFTTIGVLNHDLSKLIIGLASVFAIHGLLRIKVFMNFKLLAFLGSFSYVIYLINTISIGVAKGVLLKFTSWDELNFLWFAPVLVLAGIAIPILLKMFIFPRIKFLDRITS